MFHAFGFDTVDSMDVSDYENATILHDLNNEVPESLKNKFDCIFDGGTTEHVFNTPQVLKNVCMMLKDGGIIIHFLPTNNYIEHGFYSFNPTLFADFYSTNKFDILINYFVEHGADYNSEYVVYNYEQHSPLNVNLTTTHLMNFFVAQKTKLSTYDAVPQQGSWRAAWERAAQSNTDAKQNENLSDFFIGDKKLWFKSKFNNDHVLYKSVKFLYSALRGIYRQTIKGFVLKYQKYLPMYRPPVLKRY